MTSPDRMKAALPALDAIVFEAKVQNIPGILDIKLDEWPGAPWWLTNIHNPPGTDRYIIGDTRTGEVLGRYEGSDLRSFRLPSRSASICIRAISARSICG